MPGSMAEHRKNPAVRDDLVIEYSKFDGNNTDSYGVNCTYACDAARAKFAQMVGANIRNSSFSHGGGKSASGVWFELNNKDVKIYSNKIVGNALHGVFYEVSDHGLIVSNLIADNGWTAPVSGAGAGVMAGSANTRIYNNTLINNRANAYLCDDARSPGSGFGYDASRVGPNPANIDFINNMVLRTTSGPAGQFLKFSGGGSTIPGNVFVQGILRTVDYNTYYGGSSGVKFGWWRDWENSQASYISMQDLQRKGFERRGQFHLATVDKGAPLPTDIASLFGVTPNVPVDRGSLTVK